MGFERTAVPSRPVTDSGPRFSLVAGEGDGAILGLAAGDAAGGAWELGYSAITEQATVLAYHLIERDRLDTEHLIRELRELDGSGEEEPVYRAESGQFRAWLDRREGRKLYLRATGASSSGGVFVDAEATFVALEFSDATRRETKD